MALRNNEDGRQKSTRLRVLAASLASLFVATAGAQNTGPTPPVAEVRFNESFLRQPNGGHLDVSRFNKGNVAQEGSYQAEIRVNGMTVGNGVVTLRAIDGDRDKVRPCFNRSLLERIGVDLAKLPTEASGRLAGAEATCVQMAELVPGASAAFDNGDQRLDISVPQAALNRNPRGYIDPKFWDDGVTAAKLRYTASIYGTEGSGTSSTAAFLGLHGGFNLGAWRLRHTGNLTYERRTDTRYQSVQTYLYRAVAPLKSRLFLGDSYTDGALFDSFGFRGVQLASDDRMYPQSQRGYAPTVRGIANTNARVQIRQGGNLLYETTVSPGAFEINDLYPTGYGGDLEVQVIEADGTVRTMNLPYAPVVNALRPGVSRFSLTLGEYRNPSVSTTPMLFQGTVQHGFSNYVTLYGGITLLERYASVMAGTALNTKYGAIGLDVTQADTQLDQQPTRSGQSVRLSFSKLVAPTKTNLTLAAYRYSTSRYLALSDAMTLMNLGTSASGVFPTTRGRLVANISQRLSERYGYFYLSGSTQNYWNRPGRDTQYQASYNNNYRSLGYGITAAREFNFNTASWQNRLMVSISVPLGKSPRAPLSMTTIEHDASGGTSVQETVAGTLGNEGRFSYGVNAGYQTGNGENRSSFGANAGYISSFANLTANASVSEDYRQYGAGATGSIVAYAGGMGMTPDMGDTFAVVEAQGASGAGFLSSPGARVDRRGLAVLGTLTPFAINRVEIDPKELPLQVDLKSTMLHVTPTAGAIVKVAFEAEDRGRAVVLKLVDSDGEPLPFGADVQELDGKLLGTVGQGGRVILRGVQPDAGNLRAIWGPAPAQRCEFVSPGVPVADKEVAPSTLPYIVKSPVKCLPAGFPDIKLEVAELVRADTGPSLPLSGGPVGALREIR